jgi:hypothetical protein
MRSRIDAGHRAAHATSPRGLKRQSQPATGDETQPRSAAVHMHAVIEIAYTCMRRKGSPSVRMSQYLHHAVGHRPPDLGRCRGENVAQ